MAVAVAAPHDGGQLRGVAAKPQVLVVVGGAGLAGHGLVDGEKRVCGPGGTAGEDGLEDLGRGLGHGGADGLRGVVLVLVDHVAVAVLDLGDGHSVAVHAAGGKRGKDVAHVKGRDTHRAQRDGVVLRDVRGDTQRVCRRDDLLDANGLGHLGVAGVGRDGRGAGQGPYAVLVVAVVLDLPGGRDLHGRRTIEHDLGVHARVDGRGQDDGLEARTHLAVGGQGQVVLGLRVVLAAHHGLDVAGGGVDRDQRRGELLVAQLFQAAAHGLLGGVLVLGADGGVDLKAALQHGLGREVLEQQTLDVIGEVGVSAHGLGQLALVQDQLLGLGRVAFFTGDGAGRAHALKDDVAAGDAAVGVAGGVVVGGGVGQADQSRGLGQGKLVGVLVEINDARGLDAVGAVAVVDGVEVHVENLVFGVHLLHLDGDVGLAHLAL